MSFAARMVVRGATTGPAAQLVAETYSIVGVGSPASLQFDSNGELWATTDSVIAAFQYNWLTAGASSDCKLVYSINSGSFSSAPASGTNIGSTLVFTRAGISTLQTVSADFQIQRVSDSAVLAGPVTIVLQCGP